MIPNRAIVEGVQRDIQRRKEAKKDQKDKAHAAVMKRATKARADARLSDRDREKVKEMLKANPRISDKDLALGLKMMKKDPRKSNTDLVKEAARQANAFKAIMDLPTNVPRTKDVFSANVRAKEGGKVKGRD